MTTMEEFTKINAELAKLADEASYFSREKADLLDRLGVLWTEQGFPEIGKIWHDAATYCRRGQY